MKSYLCFYRHVEFISEHRLLYHNVEVLPTQVLETFLQPNPNVEKLEQAVGTLDEQSPVYQAMLERSKTLSDQERTIINFNCQRLREQAKARAETLRKISLLQNGINTSRHAPSTSTAAPEKSGLEGAWEWTKEKTQAGWEWTKENPVPALAIVGTASLGAYSLYRLWKWWKGEKPKENGKKAGEGEKKSNGWWWKVLLGVPVVGILGWGMYEGVQWMRKNLGSWDQAKEWMAKAENRLKSMVGLGNKGAQYGLQEEQYHDAVELWKRYGDSGTDQINKAFGDENVEGRNKFLADMKQSTDILPRNGIEYQRVGTALGNYELGLESAAKAVEFWMGNHKLEVLIGSVLAVRFGILRAILRGSSSVTMKALALGNTLRRWAQHHPLASLFILGGTAAGTFAAYRKLKEAYLPKNLQELAKTCVEEKDLIVGESTEIAKEKQQFLYECGSRLVGFTGDVAAYVEKQFGSLYALMVESLSGAVDSIALSNQEAIAEKQEDCTMILRLHLAAKLQDVQADQPKKNSGEVQRHEQASHDLEAYSDAMILAHCVGDSSSGEPESLFLKLQQSCASLDTPISLTRNNGIVQWETQEMEEPLDLSIDPSIRDREQAYALSNTLWHGESASSRIGGAMLQEWRESQQRNLDKIGHGHPFAAVLIGNILHCIDLDNIERYFSVPVDLVAGMLFESDEDRKRRGFQVTLGNAAATTIMFTLSAEVVAKIKRFAVGGGAVRFRGVRAFARFVPGASQVEMLNRMWRLKDEARVFGVLRSRIGLANARRALRALGKANILPQHISLIKYSQDPEELIRLSRAWNAGGHPKTAIGLVRKAQQSGNTVELQKATEKLRDALRKHVVDMRLKVTKLWDPMKSGKILGRTQIGAEANLIFDQVADALAPPPPAAPATPKNPGGKAPTSPSGNPSQGPRSGSTTPAGPKTQPAQTRTTGTGTAQAERIPGAGRTRSPAVSRSGTPAHELVSPEAAERFVKQHGDVGEAIEQAAANAKRLDALKASDKVRGLLKTLPLNSNLQKALDESPEFARLLFRHLDSVDDPAKLLRTLNASADMPENAALLGRVMQSEKGFARALKVVEGGGDLVGTLSKTSHLIRILKGAGRVAPVVIDAAVIFGTVCEMIETAAIIDQQKQKKVSPEVIRLTEQRYYYHAAQLGVSGVGFVAGGCLIVGVGSTVALPLVLVTLPVSVVLYGAYEGHKWKEAQERTAEDWQKEFDLIALLTDVRTYSFGERAGHAWELSNISLLTLAVPGSHVWQQGSELYKLVSGGREQQVKDLFRRIQEVDRKKIRAVVAHTTTVTIPEVVTGDDGQPRDLYPTEVKQYQQELDWYVEAKMQYILSRRQDAAHAIKSYGNITDLLEESEAAGLLAKDRPVLEKRRAELQRSTDPAARKIAAQLGEILDETDLMKQAQLYQKYLRRKQTDELYGGLSVYLAMQSPQQRKAQYHQVEQVIASTVLSNAKQTYVNYCMRSAEDNIKGGLDGDSPRIVRMYAMEQVKKLAREKGSTLTRQLMSDVDTPRDQGVWEFQEVLQDAQREVERLLANPVSTWQSMSAEDKERLGYAFSARDQVKEKDRPKSNAGEALMRRIGVNVHGKENYYTKQYGWYGNHYLYIKFDEEQGKWLADIGGLSDLQGPEEFCCCNMWGGTDKYNQLLEDLAAINRGKEPSQ